MVYECLYGKTPWPARNLNQLIDRQQARKIIPVPKYPKISEELKKVLTMMCLVEQEKRPLVSQLKEHPDYQALLEKDDLQKKMIDQEIDPIKKSVLQFR